MSEEEVSIQHVKAAIKDFHEAIQRIQVKRAALAHDEMHEWGKLQKILNHNRTIMKPDGYDECYLGD